MMVLWSGQGVCWVCWQGDSSTTHLGLGDDGAVVGAGAQLGVLPGGQHHGAQVVVGVLGRAVVGRDGGRGLVQCHEDGVHGDDLVPGHQHAGRHRAERVADQLQLHRAPAVHQDVKPGGGGTHIAGVFVEWCVLFNT